MSEYTSEEQTLLLALARQTLIAATCGEPYTVDLAVLPPALHALRACFVTLLVRETGDLRGCTGTLTARYPLAQEVSYSTRHTALNDHRFYPVQPQEVAGLQIEISILTPSQPLDFTDPADLLTKLQPGVHGVTLHCQGRTATLLPQVWERIADPSDFLEALVYKMGLPSNSWRTQPIQVETYMAVEILD